MNKYRPSLGVSSTSQFTGKKPGVTSMTSLAFSRIFVVSIFGSLACIYIVYWSLLHFQACFWKSLKCLKSGVEHSILHSRSTGAAVVALGSKWNLLLEWNAAAALGVGGQCAAAPNSQSHWLAGYRTPNDGGRDIQLNGEQQRMRAN